MLTQLKLLVVSDDASGIYEFFDKLDINDFIANLSNVEIEEFKELVSESKNILLKEQKNTHSILNKMKKSKEFYLG